MSAHERTDSRRPGWAILATRAIAGRLARTLRRALHHHRARVTIRRLEALSDWQLKDIGMHRSHIWYRAHRIAAHTERHGHAPD
jgi:uncharacterized protein YjiS (DUF1127 family)